MASGFSVTWANYINDKVWRNTDFSPGASYWIGLFTASGGAAATALRANNLASAIEVGGGVGYARVEVRGSTGIDWSVSSGGLTTQDAEIAFPQATGNWGTIYTVAVLTASTAGVCVSYGDLSVPKAVSTPDIFKIPATFFQVQL